MADKSGRSLHHQSTVTDAERATLSFLSYPAVPGVSDVKQQIEQTGKWKVIGKPGIYKSGLEIYAVRKIDTDEVVFVIRGSDTEPDGWKDWRPMSANAAFTGKFHKQHEEAITFVKKNLI